MIRFWVIVGLLCKITIKDKLIKEIVNGKEKLKKSSNYKSYRHAGHVRG